MLSVLSWWPILRKHATGTGGRGAGKVIGMIKAWVDDPLVVLKIVTRGEHSRQWAATVTMKQPQPVQNIVLDGELRAADRWLSSIIVDAERL